MWGSVNVLVKGARTHMRCGDDANDAEEGQLSHKMPAGGGGGGQKEGEMLPFHTRCTFWDSEDFMWHQERSNERTTMSVNHKCI